MLETIVTSTLAAAVVSLIASVITAKIAQKTAVKTARETAELEIKKLERTWEREDVVSSDEEFAQMASALGRFTNSASAPARREAMERVAYVRAKESGELGAAVDHLYDAVRAGDRDKANSIMSEVIDIRRALKVKASE